MSNFDRILESIPDRTVENVSIEEICALKPSIFTLENPLTYQIYLIENHYVLDDEKRQKVEMIRDKLIANQKAVTEYNLKKFQEAQEGEPEPECYNHLEAIQNEVDATAS